MGDKGKNGHDQGATGISELLGDAKLQSALGADNPRYDAETVDRYEHLAHNPCCLLHVTSMQIIIFFGFPYMVPLFDTITPKHHLDV